MNRLLTILLTAVIFCVVMLPIQSFSQASISVDHVDGIFDGKIAANTPVKFHMRWINNFGSKIHGFSIGYRVFLQNGIELPAGNFDSVTITTVPGFFDGFDFFYDTFEFSNGIGADTVGVAAALLFASGIPTDFDDLVYHISTSVSSGYVGDSLCIDSSYLPIASGDWKWSMNSTTIYPDWSGPHCYEIVESCCVGLRGNFNNSPDDLVDISDLVQIVDYMFRNMNPPECFQEGDFNGSGEIDISDLVQLVDFMFQSGPPPASCF